MTKKIGLRDYQKKPITDNKQIDMPEFDNWFDNLAKQCQKPTKNNQVIMKMKPIPLRKLDREAYNRYQRARRMRVYLQFYDTAFGMLVFVKDK